MREYACGAESVCQEKVYIYIYTIDTHRYLNRVTGKGHGEDCTPSTKMHV